MPKLYRRHSRTCPHRAQGRLFMNCRCPLWIDATEDGTRRRQPLKTRNLQRALKKLAEFENNGGAYRKEKPKALSDAIQAFMADRQADLHSVTLRKYESRLGRFEQHCQSRHVADLLSIRDQVVDEFKVNRCKSLSPLTWSKELDSLRTFFSFCIERRWIDDNPLTILRTPKNAKPRPIEPYSTEEIIAIIAACDKLGKPEARLRARAMILLMLAVGLSVMDVKTLEISTIRDGSLYMRRNKTGKPILLNLPVEVTAALALVPQPIDAPERCPYYFWNGKGTRENAAKAAGMFLGKVFKLSGVTGARPHRFRHTLTTKMLEKGGTAKDAANILGNSPAMIRKHYSLWSIKQQERSSGLLQAVHSGTFSAHLK